MSKRVIRSIILIGLAIGAVMLLQGILGVLIGGILFVLLLFLWAIPGDTMGASKKSRRPDWKPLSLAFVGIGVGLFASVAAVLIRPPRAFP